MSQDPVKCAGPDCPLCAPIPEPAPLPPMPQVFPKGMKLQWDDLVAEKVELEKKEEVEALPERIYKIAEEYGVMGMSRFAAKALAEEFGKEAEVPPFENDVIRVTVPEESPEIGQPAEVQVEVRTHAYRLRVQVPREQKSVGFMRSEARAALAEKFKYYNLSMVTRPHLIAVTNQHILVESYGIPQVNKLGVLNSVYPSTPYGDLLSWKKSVLALEENKEKGAAW